MHVAERALQARLVSRVIVATDDNRIADSVRAGGFEAVMTSPGCRSGTDRVAEVAAGLDTEIVVNVQGDEPLIDPGTIDAAIRPLLDDRSIQVSTSSEPITDPEDVFSPAVVKVVCDRQGFALLFSRSPIPYFRTSSGTRLREALRQDLAVLSNYRKHSGLYVYRRAFLEEFTNMETTRLEALEALEQLRALENGVRIRVVEVNHRSIGVDTKDDYERVKRLMEEDLQ